MKTPRATSPRQHARLRARHPVTRVGLVVLAMLAAGTMPVQAERADRDLPLTFDAGQLRIDGKRKVQVLSGGVEITRGTLVLKAALVELRETPTGQVAVATGSAEQPATFRQKRDGVDETVDGQALRIEYDTVTQTVRFQQQAQVRLLRGSTLADQISGETIVYDHGRDAFEIQGGAAPAGATGATGNGRVRGVVTPRPAAPAASASGGAR
ncbi:lipopolysaccharide transport periplasmic protein LptA [Leptothrix discophora]|uniref:Lipopolysaccharide export system protein LptA n=1 Tax=Leptothrix discophora TaxID=89 RepID=A0ABT9G6B3_LEPDI|nr:lipopolysaccharide transport periplasmic protein LptA [Leptothrix discophora]MDP4301802.1 lipopolysaccharide transport periplasmic protein LptA [Leptothrix discophora]